MVLKPWHRWSVHLACLLALATLVAACSRQAGDGVEPGPATDRLVFDQYLDVHQCLRDGGFETSDPPLTYESWVEGGEAWNPWTGFSPEDHTGMEQALRACPLQSEEREP